MLLMISRKTLQHVEKQTEELMSFPFWFVPQLAIQAVLLSLKKKKELADII